MAENNKRSDAAVVDGRLPADCVAALVYTTFPTKEAAVSAGHALVAQHHAGCVNILPSMTSIYDWNGKTEVAAEVVLIAKVTPDAVSRALAALKNLHPYETPALLVVPVTAAETDYLSWLRAGCSPVSAD